MSTEETLRSLEKNLANIQRGFSNLVCSLLESGKTVTVDQYNMAMECVKSDKHIYYFCLLSKNNEQSESGKRLRESFDSELNTDNESVSSVGSKRIKFHKKTVRFADEI